MANLSKTEMRKRLMEARKKVGLVFLNRSMNKIDHLTARDESTMIAIMRDLDKLIQKLK